MDVEAVVARRLGESTGVRAFLEVPPDAPQRFITVELISGGGSYMESAQLDIDCWAPKGQRKAASALARAVKAAVLDLDEEPNIFYPTVENAYRMNDPDTGRARYVVQAQVWVCE